MSNLSEEEEFEFRLRLEQESEASVSTKEESPKNDSYPRFLPSSKEEVFSESGSVALKGVAGLTAGLSEFGLKPVSEVFSGEPGKNIDTGIELGKIISRNIKDTIKAFYVNPTSALSERILEASGSLATVHDKTGFPVPPQPQTGIGKILGLGVESGVGFKVGKKLESSLNKPTVKLPNLEQIESTKKAIQSNLETRIAIQNEELSVAKARSSFQEDMIDKINDREKLSSLEDMRSKTAYSQSEAIHGDPVESRGGNVGLGLKASKNLNKAYWSKAEPFFNKEIYVEDAIDSVKTNLQKSGILDAQGDVIKGIEANQDQIKALKFYNELRPIDPEGVVSMLPKKMTVGELKSKLDSSFGKGYGGDILKTDLFKSAVEYVKELKDVNAGFVSDYQARNGVFGKFNIFNKIGWAKGDVSLNSGADFLENVANEVSSKVNLDNVKMIDFIKKYTGVDPSEPIKRITGDIVKIKSNAINRNMNSMFEIDKLQSRISSAQLKAVNESKKMVESLDKLGEYVFRKENMVRKIKDVAQGLAKIGVGGTAFEIGKKLLK